MSDLILFLVIGLSRIDNIVPDDCSIKFNWIAVFDTGNYWSVTRIYCICVNTKYNIGHK